MTNRDDHDLSVETRVIHSDKLDADQKTGDPVVYPSVGSTVFRMAAEAEEGEIIYTRLDNPNRLHLETVLASLEGGEACAAFASGMAACTAIVQALKPGDHLLIPEDLYHGVRTLMLRIMEPWGLKVDIVDMTKLEEVARAIRPETVMVWAETPSNPLLQIVDLSALSELCRQNDLLLVVDNTWPTPINQLPLKLGADLVIHSSSKYMGGHSDLLGGAVIAREQNGLFRRIREIQRSAGAVPSPQDCWLMLRSLRTLPYRMRAHNDHAVRIADFLKAHPAVDEVYFPGLPGHPGHETARRQMAAFGGMISFLVAGDRQATARVVQGSRLIAPVTSLGGVESTWEHRVRSEGPNGRTPENLIRLSVGLEHPEDLERDLERAFSRR